MDTDSGRPVSWWESVLFGIRFPLGAVFGVVAFSAGVTAIRGYGRTDTLDIEDTLLAVSCALIAAGLWPDAEKRAAYKEGTAELGPPRWIVPLLSALAVVIVIAAGVIVFAFVGSYENQETELRSELTTANAVSAWHARAADYLAAEWCRYVGESDDECFEGLKQVAYEQTRLP